MTSITRGERYYFFAVGFLALWVGLWGYFIPSLVDWAIPWLVPPLHARFLGSMYLSGAAFMAGGLRTRRYDEIRVVMPMIAIWTGMLFIVSLFYLPEFDPAIPPTYIWFAAYLIYPLIAVWLMWKHREDNDPIEGRVLPGWARLYLVVQGILLTVLGAALLFFTGSMVASWPWTITPLLAQIYSAPFLAYGIGSFLLARCKTWREVRIALQALFVFAAGVLTASFLHRSLFSASDLPDQLWFAGFAAAAVALGVLSFAALRSENRAV
jgi:hypothetical protein